MRGEVHDSTLEDPRRVPYIHTANCPPLCGEGQRPAVTAPPRKTLLWVGVDLDGTLAEALWTPENPTSRIGAPIWENVSKLYKLVNAGYKPVIHTARPWNDYEAIETWLNRHRIPFKQIQCGKPLFALYVDDRGRHADAESWLP